MKTMLGAVAGNSQCGTWKTVEVARFFGGFEKVGVGFLGSGKSLISGSQSSHCSSQKCKLGVKEMDQSAN